MEVLHEVMDSNFIFSKVYTQILFSQKYMEHFLECMDNYIQDIQNNNKCFKNYEKCKDTHVSIDDGIKGSWIEGNCTVLFITFMQYIYEITSAIIFHGY
jgi:hypothetical protein